MKVFNYLNNKYFSDIRLVRQINPLNVTGNKEVKKKYIHEKYKYK